MKKEKILVILGPTATGKSDLAVKLAKKYNGEVISSDSRQVYIGLDIGTGKITKKEMLGVPHYMLNVVSPKQVFSVSEWQSGAQKVIAKILADGKLPIICGGTGFYIQSIVDNIVLPEVEPNLKLRKKIEGKSAQELFNILEKLDQKRANSIEKENPVRLIRAIEIASALGKVPEIKKGTSQYNILQIGLALPEKDLKIKIHNRILSRMKKGMIKEARDLHNAGLSWKRMHTLGLEYRCLAELLLKKIDREEFIQTLEKETWQYAKRQMTWFKRDKKIKWFLPSRVREIEKEVKTFLIIK